VPSVRASLPSRIESFNAGRAGAQPYRVTTASAECGKVRQIVIRPRFLGRHAFCSLVAPDRRLASESEHSNWPSSLFPSLLSQPGSVPILASLARKRRRPKAGVRRLRAQEQNRRWANLTSEWIVHPEYRPSKTHVWLPELVEVICRGTLSESGSFKGAEKTPADMVNQIRQELSTDPVQDDWVEWTRWFLADPAERTISPFSQITVSNYNEI